VGVGSTPFGDLGALVAGSAEMRLRLSCITLVCVLVSCGKSRDIGDGVDASGGREGETGGGDQGATGGTGETGGRAGAPNAPPSGGTGGTGGAIGVPFGGIFSGGGSGMLGPQCALPTDLELVQPEALETTSWNSEDECDEAAESMRAEIEADAAAALDVKPLAGTWTDGIGDERIELVLDETGRGTLSFGDPVDLPKVDPDTPYLSGIGARDAHGVDKSSFSNSVVSGFAYGVIPRAGRASEMTFEIHGSEPWGEWCAAQEPVRGVACYACEFRGNMTQYFGTECGERAGCYVGQSSEPSKLIQAHCGRLALCASAQPNCWCTEDECMNTPIRTHSYKVTIDPLDATVLRFDEGGSTRYLTRQE
jgi:hypothetical protein